MADERSAWFWTTDPVRFSRGPHETREAAIAEAREHCDEEEFRGVLIGRVVYAKWSGLAPDAYDILEILNERSADQGAPEGDDFPNASETEVASLDAFIEEQMIPWLRAKFGDPEFGLVEEWGPAKGGENGG